METLRLLDDCGKREDIEGKIIGMGSNLHESRHIFLLPMDSMNSMRFTCQALAKGKPYYYIGIHRTSMGRDYIDYRVDIYPNELCHFLGLIKERANLKFWTSTYADIVN